MALCAMSHQFMINSCFVPDQLSCCQTGHGPDTFSDGCTVSRYALYRPVIIATIKTSSVCSLHYLHYTALYISESCTTVRCTALYGHAQYTQVPVARKRTRQTPNQTPICRPKFASYTRETICFYPVQSTRIQSVKCNIDAQSDGDYF